MGSDCYITIILSIEYYKNVLMDNKQTIQM